MATFLAKRARSLVAPLTERVGAAASRRIGLALIAFAALAFPLVHRNEGNIDAAANALAFATLALGLNIVVGFAGLLDLGYAAFFAIGAYAYGIFASYQVQPEWSAFWEPLQWLGLVERLSTGTAPDHVHFTVSFWLMLPVSGLIAAFFGVLFGAPTLRLKGDYLAIVTLGFGEIVPIVARNTPSLTNGAAGLNGVATPNLFGYGFGVESTPYYYLGLALIVFLIFVSARLKSSRIGRAWMAIREDEIAAEAMGIDRIRLKLLAFGVGAAFAGMTGAFYVAKLQTATPEMFQFPTTFFIIQLPFWNLLKSYIGVKVKRRRRSRGESPQSSRKFRKSWPRRGCRSWWSWGTRTRACAPARRRPTARNTTSPKPFSDRPPSTPSKPPSPSSICRATI